MNKLNKTVTDISPGQLMMAKKLKEGENIKKYIV